ncbi:MAG: hypothetical protein ACKN9X_03045, partial [Candidatus Methylopumilus sp.]
AASAMQEALTCARGISDEYYKSSALKDISTELAKQGKVEEALTCARGISDESDKSSALKDISTELAKQGNWALAEITGLEIPQLAKRQECWKIIAEETSKQKAWLISLKLSNQFQNHGAKTYFLKGLADSIKSNDANKELILKGRYYYQDDIESMEKLMQQYALHALFFTNAPFEKIYRLNRTFNIQRAIDIKISLNVN